MRFVLVNLYDRSFLYIGLALVDMDGKLMHIDHSAAVVWEER